MQNAFKKESSGAMYYLQKEDTNATGHQLLRLYKIINSTAYMNMIRLARDTIHNI